MNHSAERTIDGAPIDNLKQGLRDIGKSVSDVAQQSATDAKKLTADAAEQAKKMGSDLADQISETGSQQLKQLEKKIKQQPLNSVLISAGIGVVIGMLLRK